MTKGETSPRQRPSVGGAIGGRPRARGLRIARRRRWFAGLVAMLAVGRAHPAFAQSAPNLTVDNTQLAWTSSPGAVAYDIVRGDLGDLRSSAGDYTLATRACLADDRPGGTFPFAANPPPGTGWWILVRGVPAGGTGNQTYDNGGAQVGSRDAEIAASPSACPSVNPGEQSNAAIASLFGLTYTAFGQALQSAGRSPGDGPGEVRVSGPGSTLFQTPGWWTLQHGPDKSDDQMQIFNGSSQQVRLVVRLVQEQLVQANPPPDAQFTPSVSPFGSPFYRSETKTLERTYSTLLGPFSSLTVSASEARGLGLLAAVQSGISQALSLTVQYQVGAVVPAYFFADPNVPLCSGKCDPLPLFCNVCSVHYGCLSTHPHCLATSASVCWIFWVDEDTCGCFP